MISLTSLKTHETWHRQAFSSSLSSARLPLGFITFNPGSTTSNSFFSLSYLSFHVTDEMKTSFHSGTCEGERPHVCTDHLLKGKDSIKRSEQNSSP